MERERRRFRRAPIDLAVEFGPKDAPEATVGVAKDISVGGMFVQTDRPSQFGSEVIVRMSLPGFGDRIALPSTVRWTSPTGMGVQFGLLGARETFAVTQLARQSGQLAKGG